MKAYLGRMELHRKLQSSEYAFNDTEVALVMLTGLPEMCETPILNLEQDEEYYQQGRQRRAWKKRGKKCVRNLKVNIKRR